MHFDRHPVLRPIRYAVIVVAAALVTALPSVAAAQMTVRALSSKHDANLLIGLEDQNSFSVSQHFGEFEFDGCASGDGGESCLQTWSQWIGDVDPTATTDGFEATGAISIWNDPGSSAMVYALQQTTVAFEVTGLGGAKSLMTFAGQIAASPGATVTVSLSGPGTSVQYNASHGAWSGNVVIYEGIYTLDILAISASLGASLSSEYAVEIRRFDAGFGCGSATTGSCLLPGPGVSCHDGACCGIICPLDPSCCHDQWDSGCAAMALELCVADIPQQCDGNAVAFTLADRAEVAGFGLAAPTDEITIEFWQRLDGASQRTVVRCHESIDNRIITHTPWLDGNIIFDFGGAWTGGRIQTPAPPEIFDGWHHFAFVASASGQFMRIHLNGEVIASKSGANSFVPAHVPLLIADHFAGAIDELRIWSVARTPEQIAADFAGTVPPITPGLVAHYRADSIELGGLLVDHAPGSGPHHAAIVGDPTLVVARTALGLCYPDLALCDGGAFAFTNTGRAVVPGYGLAAPADEITIEFWQRLEGASNRTVVRCHQTIDNRIVTHTPWSDGNIIFDFGGAWTGGRIQTPAPPEIFDGWHHFAFVASASGQFMRIHLNGEVIAAKSGANSFVPANVPLLIADQFAGAVDELRIWSMARTPEQIAADFDRTIDPSTPGLHSYYRMDDAPSSGTLLDLALVVPGHHATIVGPVTSVDPPACDDPGAFGDLNGDGVVDGADLGILLNNWGGAGIGDLDGDGVVDGADLGLLLNAWTD